MAGERTCALHPVLYLLLRPWGTSRRALGRLLLAHTWLVGFGYAGESVGSYWILLWGAVAGLGYVSLLHQIWFAPWPGRWTPCPTWPWGGSSRILVPSSWLVGCFTRSAI